jgi:hypothetical protein
MALFLNVLIISTYNLKNMSCRRKKIKEISAFLVDVNLTILGHANITAVHIVHNKVSTMINIEEWWLKQPDYKLVNIPGAKHVTVLLFPPRMVHELASDLVRSYAVIILSVCVAVYHLDDKINVSRKIFLPQTSHKGQASHPLPATLGPQCQQSVQHAKLCTFLGEMS